MKGGFIIVEWMVHLFIVSLMGIIACMLFRTWAHRMDMLHKTLNGSLQMPIACQVLRSDLQQADPAHVTVAADRCTITGNAQTGAPERTSWRIEGDKLMRSHKRYHAREQRWLKSVRNVVAEHVEGLRFMPIFSKTGAVSCIRLVWGKQSAYSIVLRNGMAL